MAPSLIDLLRAATRDRLPLAGSIFIRGGEPGFMIAKAKFEAIRAKHGLHCKKKHIVTSFLTRDGRIVVRFGPNKLLVVNGDRVDWFAPVGPAEAQRAYQSQVSYQEQQAIFKEMDKGAVAGNKKTERRKP